MLLRTIARSRVALAGGVMVAVLVPLLLISGMTDLMGWVENPYFSLLLYLAISPLLIIAIIMIVIGLFLTRSRQKEREALYSYEFLREHLTSPERYSQIRLTVYISTILVSLFLFFLGVVAHASHKYSASVEFCASFCHTVMAPASTTHHNSPHSRVSCVTCHTGRNTDGPAGVQLSGLRQLYRCLTDTYPKPLRTPVNRLRPSRRICEGCHWPEKFHGNRLHFTDTFLPDKANSHVQTALYVKIGSGGHFGGSAQGIHWHISNQQRVFYVAADEERREISRVTLFKADGSSTTYYREGARQPAAGGTERLMDCLDCHNRPTHFLLSPDRALDRKLLNGQIPAELPFIKREALAAITLEYRSAREAQQGIAARLRQWYTVSQPELTASRPALLTQAIRGAQQAYAENNFPDMKVNWSTYSNFIGHQGCFRCHDSSLRSSDGKTISRDCTLCHIIPAENMPPEKVLRIITGGSRE